MRLSCSGFRTTVLHILKDTPMELVIERLVLFLRIFHLGKQILLQPNATHQTYLNILKYLLYQMTERQRQPNVYLWPLAAADTLILVPSKNKTELWI